MLCALATLNYEDYFSKQFILEGEVYQIMNELGSFLFFHCKMLTKVLGKKINIAVIIMEIV